jgi:hypothetical protein
VGSSDALCDDPPVRIAKEIDLLKSQTVEKLDDVLGELRDGVRGTECGTASVPAQVGADDPVCFREGRQDRVEHPV